MQRPVPRLAILLASLVACDTAASKREGPAEPVAGPTQPQPPLTGPIAEVAAAMDRSVAPCDDFFRHACGGWLASHEIPADRAFASRVAAMDDQTHELLHGLLEEAANQPGDDPRRRQIGDFYAACMDQAAIDAAGTTPLQPALAEIAGVDDLQGALETAARLRMQGVEAFLFAEVEPDYRDPHTYLLGIRQGGLGLPGREFYLSTDEASRTLLGEYTQHVADMLALLGEPAADALASARQVVALETTLARASLPLEQLREVEQTYHRTTVAELRALTPKLDWSPVFAAMGNAGITAVNVATPEYFRQAAAQLARAPKSALRAYLRWQLLRAAADDLAGPIEAGSFAWTATLTGQKTMPPRWHRCVDRTVAALPEAVGPYYVERAFAGDSKRIALEMIVAVERAFEQGLGALEWMDEITRARARAKAAAITNKIGFPERWRDHSQITVTRTEHFTNVLTARRHEVTRQTRRAGGPVDREEWSAAPSVLNAYANPLGPEMVFPAAILQPPLFSTQLPMAVNFGAIGAIMGHEITHHFDDQGRKFTADGVLEGWWSDGARAGFEKAARCVVEQYDEYEVSPGLHVNGQQTLGENIADLGALKFAHAAYMQWAAQHPETSPIPGLSPEQLFFVAYAQTYCFKTTPQMERVRVLSDVHSPFQFRAIGPLTNSPEFAAAFACAEGAAMRPARTCRVW